MEQRVNLKKRTVIPFITSLGFIAISINSLFKGIDQHELWRIIVASISGLIFIGLTVMLAYVNYKNSKTAKA
jgi:hypothetical protein